MASRGPTTISPALLIRTSIPPSTVGDLLDRGANRGFIFHIASPRSYGGAILVEIGFRVDELLLISRENR
jgi:hypothetical protein